MYELIPCNSSCAATHCWIIGPRRDKGVSNLQRGEAVHHQHADHCTTNASGSTQQVCVGHESGPEWAGEAEGPDRRPWLNSA